MKKGFTIFFAMLVSSLALMVGFAIYDLTVREIDLSSAATQSHYAIYAADTGAECGLYWDTKAPVLNGSPSAFGTSTPPGSSWPTSGSSINCNGIDISTIWAIPLQNATNATTTFTLTFSPQPYCAQVSVGKYTAVGVLYTTVISNGFNTCASGSQIRLQRTLQVSY